MNVPELVHHLVRGADGHELGESFGRPVGAVAVDELAHVGVKVVALGLAEVLRSHLVVAHGGVVVGLDVLLAQRLGAVLILVYEEEPAAQRLGPGHAHVHLVPGLVVLLEVLGHDLPWLLRNDQHAHPQVGHDLDRFWRYGGGVGTALEGLERAGANVAPRLLQGGATLHVTVLQAIHDQLGVFDEGVAGNVHVETEAVVFDLAQPPTEAHDHAAVGQMIEYGDLLGHPHRVVPRQHDDHGAQLDVLGLGRHVGEELHRIRRHGVVGEVVLNGPYRVEPQRLRQQRHTDLLLPHLAIGESVVRVLEQRGVPDMHNPNAI